MNGNIHVQFLGEGVAATSPPYPTGEVAIPPCYPACRCLAVASGGGSAHDLTPLAWRRGAWGVGRETIVQMDVGGQPGFLAAKEWVGRSALSADLLVGWGKTPRNGVEKAVFGRNLLLCS
jgi:hypothetical protein